MIRTNWIKPILLFFPLLLLGTTSTVYAANQIESGSGNFAFVDSQGNKDKPIKVWYYMPEKSGANIPVVFVMHGTKRNGRKYRNIWIEHAEKKKFLLLVPEFSEKYYPGSENYNLGNMFSPSGKPTDRSKWTYTAIEHIFDYVRNSNGIKADFYSIYGHSAGAQFVHRLVLFCPDARINTAVCANAGWYTMPSSTVEFPYGLKSSGSSVSELKQAFNQNLIILLGNQDTDENHKYLRKTPEAMSQGKHRFERGKNFYKSAKHESEKLQTTLKWKIKTVKNVGHSNSKMAKAAIKLLINKRVQR